jgi:hypothetical protein
VGDHAAKVAWFSLSQRKLRRNLVLLEPAIAQLRRRFA